MKPLKKILCYARVSSEDQKKNETIDAQITQIPKEMKRLKLLKEDGGEYELFLKNPTETERDDRAIFFYDDGFNLETLDGTHDIDQVLMLLKSGMVHAVFCDTSNRILRSKKAAIRGEIIDVMNEHDIKLFDYTGEITEGAIREIIAALNADEKKKIGRRTQAGKIRHAKNYNAPTGGITCYGYKYDKQSKLWSIVEEEAKWIRWCAHLSLGVDHADLPEGMRDLLTTHPKGVTDEKIIEMCNSMGFSMLPYYERAKLRNLRAKNPTGRMNRNWLHSMFRDDRYTGKATCYFKDINLVGKSRKITKEEKERVELARPAILDRDLYERLREERRGRADMFSKNNVHEYLLERLATCGHCETVMGSRPSYSPMKKSGRRYLTTYYVCPKNKKHDPSPCTHRKTHNTKKLDPLVWEQVKSFITNPQTVLANQATVRDEARIRSEMAKIQKEIEEVGSQIRIIDQEISALLTPFRKGIITESEYSTEKGKAISEKIEREKTKNKLLQSLEARRSLLDGIERLDLETIRHAYGDRLRQLSFDERKELTREVVNRVYVYGDHRVEVLFKEV